MYNKNVWDIEIGGNDMVWEKLGEKFFDLFADEIIQKLKGQLSDREQKKEKKKFIIQLKKEILEKYGEEEFYDDLFRVLMDNGNLNKLVALCQNYDVEENETYMTFAEKIAKDVTTGYKQSMVKNIVILIGKKTFAYFNQIQDSEHNALKNIMQDQGREIKKHLDKIEKQQDQFIKEINIDNKQQTLHINTTEEITDEYKKPVTYLLGRDNDEKIVMRMVNENLERGEKIAIWIHSIGALGKTQFCRKLYMSLEPKFSYIGWITCQKNFKLSIVSGLKIMRKRKIKNLDQAYIESMNYLNDLGKKALIFVDNYDEIENSIADLEKLQCNIIVTSRRNNPDTFQEYKLKHLSMHWCKRLFSTFYTIESNEIMNEIIHMTGYLTLAIELVAKTGQRLGLSLEDYYNKLKEKGFNIGMVIQSNWDNEGEQLNVELSKHFEKVFDMGMLKSREKYTYVMSNFSILPYLSVEYQTIRRWLCISEEDHVLWELVDLGWIEKIDEFEFMMHPIISYTVKRMLKPKYKECRLLIGNLALEIDLYNDNDYEKAFLNFPYAYAVAVYFSALNKKMKPKLALLYVRLASVLCANGEYDSAYNWAMMSYDYAKRHDNEKLALLINEICNVLAEICLDMRNRNDECKKWAKLAIKNDKRLGREYIVQISNSYHNLACAYIQLKNNEKAQENEEISLKLREEVLDPDHVKIINAKRNLAMIYRREHKIGQAYTYENDVIDRLEKKYKENPFHPDFPVAYNNYSFILKDMGRLDDAIAFQKKSMQIRAHNNINDPKLAINYHNLAMLFKERNQEGDLDSAMQWMHEAVRMNLKCREPDHIDIAEDYLDYAKIYEMTKDYSGALECIKKSKEIYSRLHETEQLKRIEEVEQEIEKKILNAV